MVFYISVRKMLKRKIFSLISRGLLKLYISWLLINFTNFLELIFESIILILLICKLLLFLSYSGDIGLLF